MEMVVFESRFVDVEADPNLTGETFSSHFANMLLVAEEYLGKRIINHTLLPISFQKDAPRVMTVAGAPQMLAIQLGFGSERETAYHEGIFQLAHESVHCFARDVNNYRNTYLEEGLAAWFAFEYMAKRYDYHYSDKSFLAKRADLQRGYNAVEPFLRDSKTRIKDIREKQFAKTDEAFFSSITAKMLEDALPGFTDAELLVADFSSREPNIP